MDRCGGGFSGVSGSRPCAAAVAGSPVLSTELWRPGWFCCLIVGLGVAGYTGLALANYYSAQSIALLSNTFRNWDDLTGALQRSPAAFRSASGEIIRERDHVFLGVVTNSIIPILVHERSLRHHVQVCGGTSSGKTYRFLVPASIQLMRRRQSSFLILDLKGAQDLVACYRHEATRAGLPFKHFTIDGNKTSYLFNPLLQAGFREFTPNQKTQCLLQALGLEYGEGYGRGHFGGVNEEVLRAVFRTHPNITSMRQILAILKAPGAGEALGISRRNFEQASSLLSILDRCCETESLQATPGDGYPAEVFRDAMDLRQIMNKPGVYHFHLPTNLERTTARMVGRLVLELLVAFGRQAGPCRVPVYVIIDECQEILADSFEPIITKCRDLNISLWLSHQSLGQLRTPSADFTNPIMTNPHLKIFFSASDVPTQEFLKRTGGRALLEYKRTSVTYGHVIDGLYNYDKVNTQTNDVPEPRICDDFINGLNSNPEFGVFWCAPGHGYCQFYHPVMARFGFAHSAAMHRRFESAPWPKPAPGTIPSSLRRQVSPARPTARPAPPAARSATPPPQAKPASPRPGEPRGAAGQAAAARTPVVQSPPEELSRKAAAEELSASIRAFLQQQDGPEP